MVFTPRICWAEATPARVVGLADALIAETKVLRVGATICFANGERRALENAREAIVSRPRLSGAGCGKDMRIVMVMTPKLGLFRKFPQFTLPVSQPRLFRLQTGSNEG